MRGKGASALADGVFDVVGATTSPRSAHSGTDWAGGKMPVESRMQVIRPVMSSVAGDAARPRWAVSIEEH
jgi:hypothetical protein